MSKTLVELVDDSIAFEQLMIEMGGEVTDEERETIVSSWLKEITSGIALKVDGYKIKQDALKHFSEKWKSEADKYYSAAKSLTSLAESLKDRLKIAMEQMNSETLEGNKYKYKLTKSPPSLEITNINDLPSKFLKITYSPDKELIKEAILNGEVVPGAEIKHGFTLRSSLNKG